MRSNIMWDTPTYFIGRNGTYDQFGVEIAIDMEIYGCGDDATAQPAICLQPHSKRGIANGFMAIPLSHAPEFIKHFTSAMEAALNESKASTKTGEDATQEAGEAGMDAGGLPEAV